MATIKQGKIGTQVQLIQVVQGQNTYNINGVDISKALILYREPQKPFEDLAKGDYTIDVSNNQQNLIIQNNTLLAKMEAIQIYYILDLTSSRYDVDFNVDINILNDKSNKTIDDLHALWEHMSKLGFIADENGMPIILPQVDDGEVLVRDGDSWRGFQVGALETEIQALLLEIREATTKALKDIEDGKNNALLGITNAGNGQNTRVLTQGNTQSNRLNSIDSQVSSKLDLMQRMMSIVVGANRWLDGGDITTRDVNEVERTADGGDIANRVGNPRRIYDGGNIADRVVDVPLDIDLGAK